MGHGGTFCFFASDELPKCYMYVVVWLSRRNTGLERGEGQGREWGRGQGREGARRRPGNRVRRRPGKKAGREME